MTRAVGVGPLGAVLIRSETVPDAAARLLGCPIFGTVPGVELPVLPRESVCSAYARTAREAVNCSACEEI
jgi:hypothetical protein